TDYSEIAINTVQDEKIWMMFDSIVAVSDDCTEIFSTAYPALRTKTSTIENILSKEFVEKQAREYSSEEMSGDESIKLLSVGRFCFAKAFDFAAEVCRRLIDDGMKVKWYLIGYGTDEQLIREKIQELSLEDHFIILGKKSNPYPYISACDIYIQPSRYEGKAVTVREAQMLGKPVVITDYKTAHTQVKNGFDAIVSPMKALALANNIMRLAQSDLLRNTLSANTQSSDYSNSNHMERIYALIEDEGE
ncbi:MAG TPA: glycosyltransferase, partial [Clostridia bacterium]|nr:glycosyltransferase [Clostridia bacterium]